MSGHLRTQRKVTFIQQIGHLEHLTFKMVGQMAYGNF